MVRQHHRRNFWLIAAIAACGWLVDGVPCSLAVVGAASAAGVTGAAAAQTAPLRFGMPTPLTRRVGDPRRGRFIAANSGRGNCIICHAIPLPDIPASAFGDLGPSLDGVGGRLSAAQLRARIVDARTIDPQTVMPPYHIASGLNRVQHRYIGRPILSAQEVEDVVAYLATLR
jgi:sulfur-oxidizing protein SoxX